MNRNEKGRFVQGNAGKPKGAKNKFTTLKEAFIGAFQEIGGQKALTQFAKNPKYRKDFLKMLASMLPKEVQVSESERAPIIPPVIQIIGIEGDGNGRMKNDSNLSTDRPV